MHFSCLLVVILLCGCISYNESSFFCGVPDYKFVDIQELGKDIVDALNHPVDQSYCNQSISLAKFITVQLSTGLATHLVNLLNIGLKICPEETIKCSIHALCEYLAKVHGSGPLAKISLQVCNADAQLRPNDYESYYRIGSISLNLNDIQNAELFLRKAESLNPT